jgi:hypothetical protein
MQVWYRLADHIVDCHEGALSAQCGRNCSRDPLRHRHQRNHEITGQRQQSVHVLSGSDEDMALEHRTVIKKSDHLVVARHQSSIQLTIHDLADHIAHATRLAIEHEFEYYGRMSTSAYTPPGWPGQVRPPGAPGWEATAIAYLLDCCPADFRAYRVLQNHPVVLAQFASHFVNAQHDASQRGLADVRTSLSEYVEPDVVEAATQAWLEQGARLARTRRAVALLEEALRGRVFVRKL